MFMIRKSIDLPYNNIDYSDLDELYKKAQAEIREKNKGRD